LIAEIGKGSNNYTRIQASAHRTSGVGGIRSAWKEAEDKPSSPAKSLDLSAWQPAVRGAYHASRPPACSTEQRRLRKTMTRREVKLWVRLSRIAAAWLSCPSAKLAEYGEGG
jgi:hypothetical protein